MTRTIYWGYKDTVIFVRLSLILNKFKVYDLYGNKKHTDLLFIKKHRIVTSTEDPRIAELRAYRERAHIGGGVERIASQLAKGKLTARERLDILLDSGTFNELEPFITHQGDELGIASTE